MGTVGEFDRRRRTVAGEQTTLGAVDFETLIITVGGAAAVVDVRLPTRRGFHEHHHGVGVADFTDRRIDQATAIGEDLDRLFAEEPARHIEIVDRHVAELPARNFDVADRWQARVATRHNHLLDVADVPKCDARLERGETRIKAAVERDEHRDLRLFYGSETLVNALQRQIDGLLAEDRFARTRGSDDQLRVRVRGRGDDDGIDLRIAERRGHISDLRTVFRGEDTGRGGVYIDDVTELGRTGRCEIGGVNGADPTGTELSEAKHGNGEGRETRGKRRDRARIAASLPRV